MKSTQPYGTATLRARVELDHPGVQHADHREADRPVQRHRGEHAEGSLPLASRIS